MKDKKIQEKNKEKIYDNKLQKALIRNEIV